MKKKETCSKKKYVESHHATCWKNYKNEMQKKRRRKKENKNKKWFRKGNVSERDRETREDEGEVSMSLNEW